VHELSIAQSIIDIAEDYAQQEGARAVRMIGLRVGALSGVVPEALEFAFSVAKMGTLAQGAGLEVEHVSLVGYCAACDREFETDGPFALCPACGEPSAEIRRGEELDVLYLEVV
jgi:hydrogenase nickel incorporation protein HypA/HybF